MSTFNPTSTTRAPFWENIYDTLARLGWVKTSSNARHSCYIKKNWYAIVPHDIRFNVRYYRIKRGRA